MSDAPRLLSRITIPVQITGDQERVVLELVSSGEYADESHVIEEALTALKARRKLRDALQGGLDELDRGEGVPAEVVFRELRDKAALIEQTEP